MKRWFSLCLCVVLVSLLACACQVREPSPQETLSFPGLAWGMSPEEALASLSVDGAILPITNFPDAQSLFYGSARCPALKSAKDPSGFSP